MKKKSMNGKTTIIKPFTLAIGTEIAINFNLDMANNRIINLAEGTDPTDCLNNGKAQNLATGMVLANPSIAQFVLLTGTASGKPIKGNIVLKNATATNIPDAVNPRDAVPLRQVKSKLNLNTAPYLHTSGGTMTNILNMNNNAVRNVDSTTAPTSVITVGTALEDVSNDLKNYISLTTGQDSTHPVTGSLIFDNIHRVKSPSDISQPKDAVSLKNLKKFTLTKLVDYLPLSGGKLTGSLNMNSTFTINNIPEATSTETTNAIPLSQATTAITSIPYLKTSGGTVTSFSCNQYKITNVTDPVNNDDLVNLQTMNATIQSYINYVNTLYPKALTKFSNLRFWASTAMKQIGSEGYSILPKHSSDNPIDNSSELTRYSMKFDSHKQHPYREVVLNLFKRDGTKAMEEDLFVPKINNLNSSVNPFSSSAITIGQLESEKSGYLSLKGGVLNGIIDMNHTGQIEKKSTAGKPSDAISMSELSSLSLEGAYIIKLGEQRTSLNWIKGTPLNWLWAGDTLTGSSGNLNYKDFFTIGAQTIYNNSSIRLLKPGCYLFLVNLELSAVDANTKLRQYEIRHYLNRQSVYTVSKTILRTGLISEVIHIPDNITNSDQYSLTLYNTSEINLSLQGLSWSLFRMGC